jgi:hypothetical protein
MVASGLESRGKDALITAVGLNRLAHPIDWMAGAGIVVCVGVAAWAFVRSDRAHHRIGWIAFAVAAYAYLGWLLQGLGFLPGMLTASPLAVVGLVVAWRHPTARLLALVAVAAMPLVWITQYSGGTAPVWGARYLLCSSTLLAVVGVAALGRMPRHAAIAMVVLAVVVTGSGLAWMVVRTHTFADTLGQVTAGDEPLVVAQAPQLLREAGGYFRPGDRWLTVRDDSEVADAVRIVARSGADRFTLVTVERSAAPRRLDGYRRTAVRVLPLTRSVDAVTSTYERASA